MSNKVKSFKVKKEYKVIRTRSTRHGKDEQEKECKLCEMHEPETWEHVMECSRTKEIRKIIEETEIEMKEIYKQWTIWKIRCKEDYNKETLSEPQIKNMWHRTIEQEKAYAEAARKKREE